MGDIMVEDFEARHLIDGLQGQDTVETLIVTLESWVLQAVEQFKASNGFLEVGSTSDNPEASPDVNIHVDGGETMLTRLREEVRQVVHRYHDSASDFAASLVLNGNTETGRPDTLLILRFLGKSQVWAPEQARKTLCQEDRCAPLLEMHCQTHPEGLELHIASPFPEGVQEFIQNLDLRVRRSVADITVAKVSTDATSGASDSELKKIWDWNNTVPVMVPRCVHDIIAGEARRRPLAPAVSAWDGELDYQQLDEHSTRFANFLVQLGAGPDDIIPLCFEKSKWMMVAILAVMKSGAVIAALDPTQPESRLQTIMKQLQPGWMIASPAQIEVATRLETSDVILLDETHLQRLPEPQSEKLPCVDPSSNLYIVFTSGSTGMPKGVMINHTNFSSAIAHQNRALGINETSRVFDFSSYAFDLSWGNIIHTFASGGCLCIPSESERKGNITDAIRRLGVNHLQLTPTVARLIDPQDIPNLRLILLIGEAMTQADVDQWTPYCTLINSYGPAECTVAVTFQTIPRHIPWDLSMGKGVGCNTWIVDEAHGDSLVSIGHTGELWLEGPLVGQGYLGDPKKTAASFVDDPAWLARGAPGIPGRRGRLYKTGDLARYNSDGSLVYSARRDTQIKIRGQRVELGDVEYHLKLALPDSIPSVAAEAITPRGSENAILTAFIPLGEVADENENKAREILASCVHGVEERLTEQLPSYMVPSMYLAVSAIPMSTTGKTDRLRLREIGSALTLDQLTKLQPSRAAANKAPQTEMEHRLQQLWAEVLNLEASQIGIDDSFFLLGGDSISAMRVAAKSLARGVQVTVPDMFKHKTISRLAREIHPDNLTNQRQGLRDQPFALSPIQQFSLNIQQNKHGHFNQSSFVRITEHQGPDAVRRAIRFVVARHSQLRARFQRGSDGTWMQRITPCTDESYSWTYHRLSCLDDAIADLHNSQRASDLQTGPLFAVDLIDTPDHQYLYLTAHGLVVDNVSWRIILKDLEENLVTGTNSVSSAPLSFQTWCHLQEQHAQEHLAPDDVMPFNIELPCDEYWGLSPGLNTHGDVKETRFTLSQETSDSLLGTANCAFQTEPVDVFLATLLRSFMDIFNDRDPPTIFSESHGRESWSPTIDPSKTVGCFTTMAPIPVLPTSYQLSTTELVRSIKDRRRQIPHNGWSYFTSRYLNPGGQERFGSHACPEISFNYFGPNQEPERSDALFQPCSSLQGRVPNVADSMDRPSLIDVSAELIEGCVQLRFLFSKHIMKQDMLDEWVAAFESSLEATAMQLCNTQPSYTLSDFPLLPPTPAMGKKLENLSQSGIPYGEVEDIYESSPLQQGILLSQAKNQDMYWTRVRWTVRSSKERSSPVDAARFELAWRMVVKRHAVLRTTFAESISSDGCSYQMVLKNASPSVHTIQAADPVDAVVKYRSTSGLRVRPVHSLVLCPTSHGDLFCELELNHAIIDAISIQILNHELCAAYDGLLPAEPGPLYSDYIRHLQTLPTTEAKEFWQTQLAGAQPCIFPTLAESNPQVGNSKVIHSLSISPETNQNLRQFCRANDLTPANVVSLAWALVLRTYTGSDSLCYGYVVSGRDIPMRHVDRAVGTFINMVVTHVEIDSKRELLTVIQEIQEAYLRSLEYNYYPLAEVLHAHHTEGQPLFNTALSVETASADLTQPEMTTIALEDEAVFDPHEYDMIASFMLLDDNPRISINYSEHLLSKVQVSAVADTFLQALENIMLHSDSKVGDLETTISPQDLATIWGWNLDVPETLLSSVPELITRCVQEQPDATAVCAWDGELTYRELEDLSSRLAHHLLARGVSPHSILPVCFEKSQWVPVAILGVLKAGCAVVTMDPEQPEERLQLVAKKAQGFILTSPVCQDLACRLQPEVIVLDGQSLKDMPEPDPCYLPTISSTDMLYLIFSSGTTGTPKGSVMSHGNACSAVRHQQAHLGLPSPARMLDCLSYAFDAPWFNFLHALTSGGCLCIPSDTQRKDNLPGCLRTLKANYALLTPSVARTIEPATVPGLETLSLGGEAISADDITRWPNTKLFGLYGPSECTVVTTIYQFKGRTDEARMLGHSFGMNAWVVDPLHGKSLVPLGGKGELWVEGPLVGQGYLGEVEQTSANYVEDPDWLLRGAPGCSGRRGRVYKTGDIVRSHSDGSLLYVGRKDTQVKIRGQRVELAEVEHHLRQALPVGVNVPVVVELVCPQGSVNPVLVAFVPIGGQATASPQSIAEALRRYTDGVEDRLMRSLPTYMIPRMYLPVAEIPFTTAGKRDQRRLKQMASSHTLEQLAALQPSQHVRRAPSSVMEWRLQEMWAAILDIDAASIAATDNFLRIGGDSIGAIRLVRLAAEQGIILTVSAIFKSPTLCDMAHVAKLGSDFVQDDIPPFTLLGEHVVASQIQLQAAVLCDLSPSTVKDILPCTPLQEGLLSLTAKRQGDYVYPQVLQLHDSVDISRFKDAWNQVVMQTSILRTRIVDLEGQGLVQVVTTHPPEWHYATNLDTLIQEHLSFPVTLGTALARCGLVEVGGEDQDRQQYFVLTLHHALYDGWSMSLLLAEVGKAYHGTASDGLVSLNSLIKYVRELGAEADSYWRDTLDGLAAVPFPSPSSPLYQTCAQDMLEYQIPEIQWPQNHITPATSLRAAWAILTAHYTQCDDVIFGSTVTGRQAPVYRVEAIEGPTIATVPVRVTIPENMNVMGLLEQVQEQSIDMIPYEQVGLQRIQRLGTDAERACQFQTLLVVQPAPETTVTDGSPSLFHEDGSAASQTSLGSFNSYALLLQCQLTATGLSIQMSYDSHVMAEPQVQRLAVQFEHILRLLCDESQHQSPVYHLEAICDEDLRRVWTLNSPVPTTVEACMHDIFTKHARQKPASQAVASWDGNLTYSELDEHSTKLAHHLHNSGVGPGAVVALCFEKSMWMPVAMLGVMKAGGASVALDITQPEDRLRTVVEQVQPVLVLCSIQAKALAQSLIVKPVDVVSQQTLDARSSCSMEHGQLPVVQPTDRLYICFTSGSTGVPKGAMMSHQNMASAVYHQRAALDLTDSARVFDFSSYAFDACWMNFVHTIAAGACFCIPSDEERKGDLAECMGRLGVTFTFLTPSTARLINPASVPDLQILVIGGEAATQQDIIQWKDHVQLKNLYGPAECSAASTIFDISSNEHHPGTIGAGKGMATWVVEPVESRQLSPYGAVGELWLEGPLVGLGYLGRPDLSAASFTDNPPWLLQGQPPGFSGRTGRMYRTGDLVRYNQDGTLVYIERKDAQVKIRGQRVELAEVEYHLNQTLPPAAAEIGVAVEVLRPQGSVNPILVAYLAIGEPALGSLETIRAKLAHYSQGARERLEDQVPSYMVPSLFVPVVSIPMTVTGKRDRRRLHETWASRSLEELADLQPTRGNFQAPTTDLETQIQALWAECLNISASKIGMQDSFFALGGDSISAMQLSAKSRSMNLQIAVPDIFRCKTIARLALGVSPLVNLAVDHTPDDQGESFALSPIQQMFADTLCGVSHHFNQSFFVQVRKSVTLSQLNAAMDAVVGQHGMLRARFECDGERILSQRILPPGTSGNYRVSQHEVADSQATSVVIHHSQLSLDIQNGPVMAVDLINAPEGQSLFLVAHHMVVDLVSWRIILADLEDHLTNSSISGLTSMSFQSWCRLQADHAQSHCEVEAVLPDGTLPLPPPDLAYWGQINSSNNFEDVIKGKIVLTKQVTETLLGPANAAFDTQPVELLHASILHSFAATFHDRTPPTVFSEGHGREPWSSAIDISRTVGWFTTMFPIVAAAKKGDKIANLVRQVKDLRRQMPSNGRPYFASRFLSSAGKEAFQSNGPVEIMFNYLGLYQQLERADALFNLRSMPDGVDDLCDISGKMPRFALVDISASVTDGCLHVEFLYNQHMKHQTSIRTWIEECKHTLQTAARELPLLQPSYTACSFPLLRMREPDLPTLRQRLTDLDIAYGQVEDIYPCSPLQEGIILSQIKNPSLYRTRIRWMARSRQGSTRVDTDRIKQAWQQLVDRHAALRTIFIDSISGRGLKDQLVVKDLLANVHIVQPTNEARIGGTSTAKGDTSSTFILSPTDSGVLCELSINHACIDARSLGIIKEELCAAYDDNLPSAVAPLYKDYIQFMQSVPTSPAEKYWQSHLKGVNPCIFPPLDGPEAGGRRLRTISSTFDQELHLSLRAFCMEHGLTTSNVFHVAWALALRAYTGLETVCFGYLTSGRNIPLQGADRTVGPFINMLVSRVDLANGDTLTALVQRNQEQYLQSLEFQHCPLAKIFHLADTPEKELFNTAMSLQSSGSLPQASSSTISLVDDGGDDPTEYDILINIGVGDEETALDFNFNGSKVSESHAKSALDIFHKAVKKIVQHGDQTTLEANFISRHDLQTIWDWNSSPTKPVNRCVHEFIMEQAERQPAAAAICAWDGSLTYKELNDMSTNLAFQIGKLGVGPGMNVPLLFEKSRWMSVASLAVMKAGGTMVSLDPSQPEERLRVIIDQVQPGLILASGGAQVRASSIADCPVVPVEAASLAMLSAPLDASLPTVDPAGSLYLVFTSGSSGLPKGVAISHSNFSTGIAHQRDCLKLSTSSRVLEYASYAFDVSWGTILATLGAGGCVCIPEESERRGDISATMRRLEVNYAGLTPSVARLLDPSDTPLLKTLVLAGEPVSQSDVKQWSPHVDLINAYGPAETTVWVTFANLGTDISTPSIGKGVACNTWVVDPCRPSQLTPLGCVGELWLEGPLVGRGYYRDPERTTAAFIENPQWLVRGPGGTQDSGRQGRLYRTGDLVRYMPDGSIAYIGRKDNQVKIHGQRVELEEVEKHIQQAIMKSAAATAMVSVVAAIVVPKGSSKSILAAYLALGNSAVGPLDVVRTAVSPYVGLVNQSLEKQLPSYMRPSIYIPVAEIPTTTNGKTDRRMLQAMASIRTLSEWASLQCADAKECTASSPGELELQRLFAEVLNIDQSLLGVNESFFSLGGDSITAMQLSAKSKSSGVYVTVGDIFRYRTVVQLSKHAIDTTAMSAPLREATDNLLDLSPAQELFFASQDKGKNLFNQTILARVSSPLNPNTLRQAIEALIARHPMLRARFSQAADGAWKQKIMPDPAGCYVFREHQITSLEDIEPVLHSSQESMDISQGPVLVVDLIESSQNEQYVFLVAHHLVMDLESWRITLRELEEYMISGRITGFTPFPFQSWNHLQTNYSRDHSPPQDALPFDVRPPQHDYWGLAPGYDENTLSNAGHSSFTLDRSLTEMLMGPANSVFNTQPLEVLHAALLYAFVNTFPDRDPPPIFTEGHGREVWDYTIDLSRTVGCFTTLSPVSAPIKRGSSLADAVQCVKDTRRQAPRHGSSHFTSQHLNSAGRQGFTAKGPVEIIFNCTGLSQQLGRHDSLFQQSEITVTKPSAATTTISRFSLVDVTASVTHGQLRFKFTYNKEMKPLDKILEWINQSECALRTAAEELVVHSPSRTICDFPLLSLSQETLDELSNRVLPGLGLSYSQIEDIYPAAPVQQGMIKSQTKSNELYWTRLRWTVQSTSTSPIDLDRLKCAWQLVVKRHSVLRTIFIDGVGPNKGKSQLVFKDVPVDVKLLYTEQQILPVPASGVKWHTDLSTRTETPQHSLVLTQTASGRVFCDLELNHTMFDGHSLGLMKQEICAAYTGSLPTSPAPSYKVYIEHLSKLPVEDGEQFWQAYLHGVQPCHFPTLGQPGTSHGPQKRTALSVSLDSSTHQALLAFCQQHGVTSSNVLYLAWGILLRAVTGADKVSFGYATSGRDAPIPGVHMVLGPLMNMLVCVLDFGAQKSVRSTMEKVQEDYLAALRYQFTPLGEDMQLSGTFGQGLINTAVFAQVGPTRREQNLHEISIADQAGRGSPDYDIAIAFAQDDVETKISFDCAALALSEEGVQSLAGLFLRVVEDVLRVPDQNAHAINLISQQDLESLRACNQTDPQRVDSCHNVTAQASSDQLAMVDNQHTDSVDSQTPELGV